MRIPDPLLCARFAPILRFDAREQCFPSAVETFLQNVDLCRRRLLTPLDGDPPVWVTTTFFSGDAKVLAIRAPAPEALIGCGYAPGGAESSTGPGTSDFFLRERSTKARGGTPPSPSGQPPIYVSAVGDGDLIELSYWLFCPYNPAFGPFAHVGDWEHVVVRLDAQGRLLGVLYHYHADASGRGRRTTRSAPPARS